MNLKSASGLTLVELVVVIVILLFLASSIEVCPSSAVMQANMTAVGARGKDIWVAVTRENAEREALGLPPLWPRDFDPAVDTNATELARLDFDNSTDYFRWLYENRLTVTNRVGFDYSRLAGAGVSACSDDKRLSATNNMWIVAKNVRDDMDDIVPVLITRNIDASSLAARVGEQDLNGKALRFDPGWKTPFSDKGFVMIRKGGAIFKARAKYMGYKVVYMNTAFDTALTTNGAVAPPLKYLTPDREVTLGDQAYAEGATVAYQLARGHRGKIKRNGQEFVRSLSGVWGTAWFLGGVYLIAFAINLVNRKRFGMRPLTSAPIIGVWGCHFLVVMFSVAGFMVRGDDPECSGFCVMAALTALAVGFSLAIVFQRHDREARRRQIKWLIWLLLFLFVSSSLFPAV